VHYQAPNFLIIPVFFLQMDKSPRIGQVQKPEDPRISRIN
jgi:hypothetical protein